MHLKIRKELNELRDAWPPLNLGSGLRATMPETLELSISAYCERAENRDGRGVRSAIISDVRKTLRHLRSAAKRATTTVTREGRESKKLLKSLHHTSDFEIIFEQARNYAGTLQRIGKQKARRAPVCERRTVHLGESKALGEVYLERIVSVAELMSIGRRLMLCVARDDDLGREYHHRLRQASRREFWQLRTGRAPLALLEIVRGDETKRGLIVECETATGFRAQVLFPRSILLRLVRELNASGDKLDAFQRVGAFWVLRRSRRPTAKVEIGSARYRVWRFPDEVIIEAKNEDHRGRLIAWSRFVKEDIEPWHLRMRGETLADVYNALKTSTGTWAWSAVCSRRRALRQEQLQALILASPKLYALLAEH